MAEIILQLKGYRCERCKHEWAPRNEGKPIICPKCKSPYWNKPRRMQVLARKMQKSASELQRKA